METKSVNVLDGGTDGQGQAARQDNERETSLLLELDRQ